MEVTHYNVDVSKMAAVTEGVKQVVQKYDAVHLLVNNAVNWNSASMYLHVHVDVEIACPRLGCAASFLCIS